MKMKFFSKRLDINDLQTCVRQYKVKQQPILTQFQATDNKQQNQCLLVSTKHHSENETS